MKLSRISIKNFQGLRAFDIPLRASILMFSGPNGAGKSSLRDALAMGLSGEPTRVSKKKDYDQLVNDGQTSPASISIDLADGRRSETVLPGEGTKFAGKQLEDPDTARAALPYLLAPEKFAAASADDRRGVLFTLTGCGASADEVQKRLAARSAAPAKIEAVLPLLRSGFPAAEEEARNRAKEAKGAWRGVTGATYGPKVAEGWKADKPVVAEQDLLQAEHDLDVVDGEIAQAQQQLGELQANFKAQQARAGQLAALEEKAGRISKIQRKLESDQTELNDWEAKVKETEAKASGAPVAAHWECPCCQNLLTMGKTGSLERYEVPDAAPDAEAKFKLPEHIKSRDLMARAVENDKRDLAAAQEAEAQLRALEEGVATPVEEAEIHTAAQRIDTLQTRRKKLAADLEEQRAQQRAADEADKKTKAAAQHHADVLAWSLIADAMAPDGIPGELLNDALRPVNDRLHSLAKTANWARVQITRDMDITADGRLYGLLSESEQWRADCSLALTLAGLSGLKLVLLDRFDVLDLQGRGDLLDLLYDLAERGEIDTAAVFGTLKKAPASDDIMGSFWVENGEVSAVAPAQERVAA